jgi:hypothetical protein
MLEKIIIAPKFCKAVSVFIDVGAITLYPFIVSRNEMSKTTLNHERIHLVQQRELWLLGFYVLYILYWLKGKVSGMTNRAAYMNIPFEKEAYTMQEDLIYTAYRAPFAWKQFT